MAKASCTKYTLIKYKLNLCAKNALLLLFAVAIALSFFNASSLSGEPTTLISNLHIIECPLLIVSTNNIFCYANNHKSNQSEKSNESENLENETINEEWTDLDKKLAILYNQFLIQIHDDNLKLFIDDVFLSSLYRPPIIT